MVSDFFLNFHKQTDQERCSGDFVYVFPERSNNVIYVPEHKLRRGNCIASWEFYRPLLIIHRLVWLSDGCNCVRELVKRIRVVVAFQL